MKFFRPFFSMQIILIRLLITLISIGIASFPFKLESVGSYQYQNTIFTFWNNIILTYKAHFHIILFVFKLHLLFNKISNYPSLRLKCISISPLAKCIEWSFLWESGILRRVHDLQDLLFEDTHIHTNIFV